jgi:hypothetical protein
MPLRRRRGGRRPPPLGSRQAREESGRKAANGPERRPTKQDREAKPEAGGAAEEAAERERAAERQRRAERGRARRRKPSDKPARRRPRAPAAKRRGAAGGVGERVGAARAALQKAAAPRARKALSDADKGLRAAWKRIAPGLSSLLAGLKAVGVLVLGGLQEIGAVWIRAAELAGAAILWAERTARPYLIAALRALRRALAFAQRVVTPERTVAAVVVAAAIVLAVSQFVDYRGVEIGAPAYEDVKPVAPAPQTDVQTTGSVHGYAMVPVAVIMIVAALLALRGRWRLARVIPVLAGLTIAVSLLLDARKGLQEGEIAIAYQGTHAVLIEGFWLQLASAAVLVVTGLLLSRYARVAAPAGRRRGARRGERPRRRRFRIAGVRA